MRSKKICAAALAAVLTMGSASAYAFAEGTQDTVAVATGETETQAAAVTGSKIPGNLAGGLTFTQSGNVYYAAMTAAQLKTLNFSVANASVGRTGDGYYPGFYVEAFDESKNGSITVPYTRCFGWVKVESGDSISDKIKALTYAASSGADDGQFWPCIKKEWLSVREDGRNHLMYAIKTNYDGGEDYYYCIDIDLTAIPDDFAFTNPCTINDHDTLQTPCTICGNKMAEPEEPFEDTDTETGITAEAEAGAVPEGTELVVVSGENDPEGEVSFDITLVDGDGDPVQPAAGKSVTVTIPVPASMTANKTDLKVFYKNGNTYTNMNAVLSGDNLVFSTNHFSTYVITTKDLALNNPLTPATPVDPVTTTTSSTGTSSDATSSGATSSDTASSDVTSSGASSSDTASSGAASSDAAASGSNSASSGNSNPTTGVVMGIFPAVLAAGAIVVIARKKK